MNSCPRSSLWCGVRLSERPSFPSSVHISNFGPKPEGTEQTQNKYGHIGHKGHLGLAGVGIYYGPLGKEGGGAVQLGEAWERGRQKETGIRLALTVSMMLYHITV